MSSSQTPPDYSGGCACTQKSRDRMVNRVSAVGIVGNIALTVFKLFAGVAGRSGAMLSDAIHSMSDVFATAVAFLGVRMAGRTADKAHPYGHERMECVASLVLGAVLLATGLGIGAVGVEKVAAGSYGQLAAPGGVALLAAVVSIVVKEAMFWYTRYCARALNSPAFLADAWHHRSDALSSVGSLVGIGGAMLGFPVLDPIAGVVICLFILKVAWDILRDALKKMLDTSCGEEYERTISEYIAGQEGVVRLDLLRTRMFGNRVYIDAEIAVEGSQSLEQAHAIAERVHDGVEQKFDSIKHIMIHVNPAKPEGAAKP